MLRPFNYIHLSRDEIGEGFYAYYCLSKVNDLRLKNIKGYFVMADDTTFNFWNTIDLSVAFLAGNGANISGGWWNRDVGLKAAKNVISLFEGKYKNDTQAQTAWKRYGEESQKGMGPNYNASTALTLENGWTVSDLYYVPSTMIDYHSALMEVFFEGRLFHEIAMKKFFYSVPTVYPSPNRYDHLYGKGGRDAWHDNYKGSFHDASNQVQFPC
ncbi:hypothetical protein COOONC_12640 [Cooperia oncophora]